LDSESHIIEVDSCRLAAELVYAGGHRPAPAVILCHGIPAAPYLPGDNSYLSLCQDFARAGLNTLFFRFRGAGDSTGDFDFGGWARDLQGVIRWVFERQIAVYGKLAIVGSSAGGAVAAHVTADEPGVGRLVLLASPADMSALAEPQYGEPFLKQLRSLGLIRTPGFPEDRRSWAEGFTRVVPMKAIAHIAPRPVLIVQGDKDTVVSPDQARQLYDAALQPKELRMVKGAGHRLRLDLAVIDGVISWLLDR
jgi:alpha-beta hydrolase superfamily lysophospholipase